MIAFPNAKINLGLNILRKRSDGYHDIESCLYPIPWCDVLEIVQSEAMEFHATGLSIPGEAKDNLCLKAYHLVKGHVGELPPVAIYLHKVVPMGAGLGGGSSDGAHMIKLLNDEFALRLELEVMEDLASRLGSDCPFFIRNEPAMASGTGTQLSPIDLDLSGKYLAISYPAVHVSTREAYAGVKPSEAKSKISQVLKTPLTAWEGTLNNDFEGSIFPLHPLLGQLKSEMYQHGAIYAAMSGSGSAMFGLFDEAPTFDKVDFCQQL